MKRLEIILLLAATSFLMTFTKADPESNEANKETEVKAEDNEKQMKKILQKQLEDNAKGDTEREKLIATLSVTVAQLEMENHKRDEETKREMQKTKMEIKENNKRDEETKREMRKTKREIKEINKRDEETKMEMRKEIENLRVQMKKKDNKIRQLDEKFSGPKGPVEPLEKFLQQTESKITNHTKRIVKLEDAFCGKCERSYGKKFIRLQEYFGSHYGVYPEDLVWDTARAACANRGGELASMETEGEWRHIWAQLKAKDNNWHWLGAHKVGGGGRTDGFKWLTNGTIPGNYFAWYSTPYNGKCLASFPEDGSNFLADNNWTPYSCEQKFRALCEFKN